MDCGNDFLKQGLKVKINCETFLSEYFMKYSFRGISWNIKYFHEIGKKYLWYHIFRTSVNWQIPALSSNECCIILLIIDLLLHIHYVCILYDCNWTRTQNHSVRKRTVNHSAKLAKRVQLQSLKRQISRLLRARSSFDIQATRECGFTLKRVGKHDKNIQSYAFYITYTYNYETCVHYFIIYWFLKFITVHVFHFYK